MRLLVVRVLAVAMFLAVVAITWLSFREKVTTADVTMSVLRQPREEVVIKGLLRNAGTTAFSLETLLIEEPEKTAYKRQVSLDADRKFELVLGKPLKGVYRASVLTRCVGVSGRTEERWLKLPELVVAEGSGRAAGSVNVRDLDDRSVAAYLCGAGGAGLIVVWWAARRSGWQPPEAHDAAKNPV